MQNIIMSAFECANTVEMGVELLEIFHHLAKREPIKRTVEKKTADVYTLFIQENVHVITPNKRANVLPYDEWKDLMDQFKKRHCHFLCRTNVGAGLPVLTVLEDLISTNNIKKITKIFCEFHTQFLSDEYKKREFEIRECFRNNNLFIEYWDALN